MRLGYPTLGNDFAGIYLVVGEISELVDPGKAALKHTGQKTLRRVNRALDGKWSPAGGVRTAGWRPPEGGGEDCFVLRGSRRRPAVAAAGAAVGSVRGRIRSVPGQIDTTLILELHHTSQISRN